MKLILNVAAECMSVLVCVRVPTGGGVFVPLSFSSVPLPQRLALLARQERLRARLDAWLWSHIYSDRAAFHGIAAAQSHHMGHCRARRVAVHLGAAALGLPLAFPILQK